MPIAGQVGSQSIKYWPTVTQLQTPDTSVMCDCERPVAQRLWHVSGLVLLTGPHVVTDSGLVTSDKLETCAGSPVAQFPGPAVTGQGRCRATACVRVSDCALANGSGSQRLGAGTALDRVSRARRSVDTHALTRPLRASDVRAPASPEIVLVRPSGRILHGKISFSTEPGQKDAGHTV